MKKHRSKLRSIQIQRWFVVGVLPGHQKHDLKSGNVLDGQLSLSHQSFSWLDLSPSNSPYRCRNAKPQADTARTRCSCRLHHKKLINHMSIVNLRRWTKLCDAFPFWRFHSCCLQGLACKIAPKVVPGLASCIPQVHDPPTKNKNKNAACPTHIEDLPNQPQVSEALLFNFGG